MKDLKHIKLAMKESEQSTLVSEIAAIIKHNPAEVAIARIEYLIKGAKS